MGQLRTTGISGSAAQIQRGRGRKICDGDAPSASRPIYFHSKSNELTVCWSDDFIFEPIEWDFGGHWSNVAWPYDSVETPRA